MIVLCVTEAAAAQAGEETPILVVVKNAFMRAEHVTSTSPMLTKNENTHTHTHQ